MERKACVPRANGPYPSALYSWVFVVAMIIVHHDPPSTIPARLCFVTVGPLWQWRAFRTMRVSERHIAPFPHPPQRCSETTYSSRQQPTSVRLHIASGRCLLHDSAASPSRRVLLTCFGRHVRTSYFVGIPTRDRHGEPHPQSFSSVRVCIAPTSVISGHAKAGRGVGGAGQN